MNAFRNIRIYPSHGTRSALVTWEVDEAAGHGDVYAAFSATGTKGTWRPVNPNDPVPSAIGMLQDKNLVMDGGTKDGFYRLLLIDAAGGEHFSAPIQILGDLTVREHGIVRAALHQEYTQMRVTNGFPIWHCIPRAHGTPAATVDPDTGAQGGGECATPEDEKSYGMAFQGGFYPPVLSWMRVLKHSEALQDDPEDLSPNEIHSTAVRMMAFPRPARNHMIVNPSTDERYLVSDEVKPMRFRGIIAIAYLATLEFLGQSDERYGFPCPPVDIRAYRRMKKWAPQPCSYA